MAATLEQIFQYLEEQRKVTPQKSPVADAINKLVDAMSVMRSGISSLDDSIKEQRVAQGATRNLAVADDVREKIRTLLELKVSEDKIERERHQRMMDVAESVVPQITDEQLEVIREQRKAYREQQWALKEELRLAEETAKVQKESSQAIADAEKFAITDKYGTISSAVSGLESKAQDPLSKMLAQGLGRFVKGKEEDKNKVVVKAQADRDRIIERDATWKKEDIQEDAAIDAYRKGIKDPGSAIALFKQREQQVSKLSNMGESIEEGFASGDYNKGGRKNKKNRFAMQADRGASTTEVPMVTIANKEEPSELPTLTKSGIKELADVGSDIEEAFVSGRAQVSSPVLESAVQDVATVISNAVDTAASLMTSQATVVPDSSAESTTESESVPEAKPAPKNAKFKRRETQTTNPVTPNKDRQAEPTASRGMFGSKAGSVNLGGIGKAIGGILGSLKSMAGSFLKFLGPWGVVANALMSFDRLVPLISDGAGALMDMAKLIMPLTVTALLEGFSGILQAVDGLLELLQQKLLGKGMRDDLAYSNFRNAFDKREQERFEKEQAQKGAITSKGTTVVNTTSAVSRNLGGSSLTRRETLLTSPSEAESIRSQARAAQTTSQNQSQFPNVQAQREQNEVFKEAVIASAKNPGTTPVWMVNPALSPWSA